MRASELYGGGAMLGELVSQLSAAANEISNSGSRYLRSGFMTSNLGTHNPDDLKALTEMGLASPFVMTEQSIPNNVIGAGGRFFRSGFTSTNGVDWVAMTGTAPNSFSYQQNIVFFNGAWYGTNGTNVVRSTDGVSWTATSQAAGGVTRFIVAFGVLYVVYFASPNVLAARTSNGTAWTASGYRSVTNSTFSVAFTGNKLVVAHNVASAGDLGFMSTTTAATDLANDTGYSGMGSAIGTLASAGDGVLHFQVGSNRLATAPNGSVFAQAESGVAEVCSVSGAILQRTQNGALVRINAGGTIEALGNFGQAGTPPLDNIAIAGALSALWVSGPPNRFLLGNADLRPLALGAPSLLTGSIGTGGATTAYVRLKP